MSDDNNAPDFPVIRPGEKTTTFVNGKHPGAYYSATYHCHIAKTLATLGATDTEIANGLGIHRVTLYKWKNLHPEFAEAMRVGKEAADARVERATYQSALGYDYTEKVAMKLRDSSGNEYIEMVEVQKHKPADHHAQAFWLANRRPEQYSKKGQEPEAPSNITNVTTINLVAPEAKEVSQPEALEHKDDADVVFSAEEAEKMVSRKG